MRRIGVYLASITLGVGALVAIHSFRSDVSRAVRQESRTLLGGDLRFESQAPLPERLELLLDSLTAAGARTARSTNLVSMVSVPATEQTRLLQVRGITTGFPLYGTVRSDPEGAWERVALGGQVAVDPAVLPQLGVRLGDTIQIGELRIPIGAVVEGLPADAGFQTAVGPRVYLAADELAKTGLVGFGTLARYEALVRMPGDEDPEPVSDRYRRTLTDAGVSTRTAEDQAESLSEGLETLGRLLGLVGLIALLLGGIGVASAIHLFVRERLTGIAVLRCLGARQRTVFTAYLLQAAGLGALGSLVGVVLGVAAQALLPLLLRDFLPIRVDTTPAPGAMLAGLGMGIWVSVVFALLPLLGIRDATPLHALRRDVEEEGSVRWDPARIGALVALAGSLILLSVWQAPEPRVGVGFAAGLAVVVALLWAAAQGLVRLTRRGLPGVAPWALRQGVSNLHRPRNQTVTITLALGFGTFLLSTIGVVEQNLADRFRFEVSEGAPNTVLFDIQPAQRAGVEGILAEVGGGSPQLTPIVPGRIAGIRGRSREEMVADTTGDGPARWALRRVYRNTYQRDLRPGDQIVAGEWWSNDPGSPPDGVYRVSVEADLASDLGVAVGDRITWDIQGVDIETRVASLRVVDWAQLETNFFVVFEPGLLEVAPHTLVGIVRLPDADGLARVQRALQVGYPNVSVADLAQLRETVERILGTVSRAIRILSLLTVLGGVLVLAGALATSRYQRIREGALLRTLGARRDTLVGVFLAEYAALGVLSALTGGLLGVVAGYLVTAHVFNAPFRIPVGVSVAVPGGLVLLTLVLGVLNSRGILTRAPLPILREVSE